MERKKRRDHRRGAAAAGEAAGAPLRKNEKGEAGAGVPVRKNEECEAGAGIPVRKNEECIAEVIGIGHDGAGVGRVNGYTLFIQGALPGERVRVKALKLKKQYGYVKLLEVIEASPDRVEPPCPVYRRCGGCQLQHLGYGAQLRFKRQHVVDSLERIGKLKVREDGGAGVRVLPTLGMSEPWRYRNKAQVPIGESEAGLIGGFYAQGSHRIVETDACLIQHERNDASVRAVKRLARELGIPAYHEETGRGLLRHVVAKVAVRTGEIMIVLVTAAARIPRAAEWIAGIRRELPDAVSICQNINPRDTNAIFGDETRVLWGKETIEDRIGDIRFAISARSFYQVNPLQTRVLYDRAVVYAGLTGKETVIDAYCGIGTISLFLARHAGQVYGVEIIPEAIEDARKNAELNGIDNVHFEAGKAEEVIPAWRRQGIHADVIVVDPPRKGCDPALLATIIAMRLRRVVYVSCNPSTLARDLRILEDGGFRAVEAQPVDMFPWTVHVEVVCSLIYKDFG